MLAKTANMLQEAIAILSKSRVLKTRLGVDTCSVVTSYLTGINYACVFDAITQRKKRRDTCLDSPKNRLASGPICRPDVVDREFGGTT